MASLRPDHLFGRHPLYGTPYTEPCYTEPCPCEEAAKRPEDRTVHIELDGILRQVSAQYHRVGLLAGRLVTERIFRAEDPVLGECPVPVPMGLYHPTEQTDPRLIVIDDHGHQWVMSFRAQHNLQRFKITGFAEEDTK